MARWRLTAKHYINATRYGEPTQWVREETSRETGRVNRKTYNVPMYLDPDSPADCNYPGEIIVSTQRGSLREDIVVADNFIPTRDMEPLDDEAREISERSRKGADPMGIEAFPNQGGETYSDTLLRKLTDQLESAMRGAPVANPPNDELKKMKEDIARLMDANSKLQAQLAARK